MRAQVSVGKVVGLPGQGWWGQVHDFTPTEEEKVRARGRLIAVVSARVEASDELTVVTTGREVLARLHELYFGSFDPFGGLRTSGLRTAELGETKAMEVLRRAAGVMGEEYPGVGLAAAAFVERAVYVATQGGAGVWIKEGDREGWLVEPGGSGAVILSGWAKPGMLMVAGNQRFWEEMPVGVMRAVMGSERASPEGAAEALGAVLLGRGKSEGEVGAVIQILDSKELIPNIEDMEKEAEVAEEKRAEAGEVREKERNRWWEGVVGKVREGWGAMGSKSVFVVHQDQESSRRKMRRVGAVFLAAAVLLFGGGRVLRKVSQDRKSEKTQKIEAIAWAYNEAKSLVGLNSPRAREMLGQVRQKIDGLDKEAKRDEKILAIEGEWGEVLGAASGITRVTIGEVVDLGLVRDGLVARAVAAGEGKLWIAAGEGRIVVVDPIKKSGRVVWGGEDTGGAGGVAVYPGRVYAWSGEGISECTISNEQCKKVVVKNSKWGEIADVEVWAANLYLLDRGTHSAGSGQAGKIWKYQGGEGGFGEGQEWLVKTEDNSSLSGSTSMTVDGSIWVASGGVVAKYTRGVKDNFEVAGMDQNLGGELKIYTDDGAKKLYVLDRVNSRIVSVDKQTGGYAQQWVGEKLGGAADMVVDEKAGKIYIVGGRYVWEISL